MNNEETLLDYAEQPKQENEPKTQPKAKATKKEYSKGNVAAAAAAGAVVGAGATFAGQAAAANTADATEATPATDATPKVAIVDETKDFTSAFNEAREEVGPGGVFEYHGKLYNTYTEDEWNKMSAEDQNAFNQEVKPMADRVDANNEVDAQSVEVHHTATADAQTVDATPEAVHPASDEVQAVDVQPEDTEIHVLGVEHNVDMGGETVDVAAIEVDGHQGYLVDVDQNGTADASIFDYNGNGVVDESDIHDISDAGMQMPDSDPGASYLANADDMPDYTNDAALV